MKICSLCLKEKNLIEFYKDKNSPDKLSCRCKECIKLKAKEWSVANKERSKEIKDNWRKNNPDKVKLNYQKQNQKDSIKRYKQKWYFEVLRPKLEERGIITNYYSEGENIISSFLSKNKIKYERDKSIEGCINPKTNSLLFFDFYLPELKLYIEYDGIQHFDSRCFNQGEEGLLDLQFKDNLKNKFCEINKIKLLRISYKEKTNLKEILTNYILNL